MYNRYHSDTATKFFSGGVNMGKQRFILMAILHYRRTFLLSETQAEEYARLSWRKLSRRQRHQILCM
ncbi:MAG: hypothetical protein ACW98X_25595 [Promethearchaeota archaeon]